MVGRVEPAGTSPTRRENAQLNAVPGLKNLNVRNNVGLPEAPRALDLTANTPTTDAPQRRIGNVETTEAKVATAHPHARMTVPFLATNAVGLLADAPVVKTNAVGRPADDRVVKTNDVGLVTLARTNAAHATNAVGRPADDRVVKTNDVGRLVDDRVVRTNAVDLVTLAPTNAAHETNDVGRPADDRVVKTNDVDLVRLDRMAVTNAEDVVTNGPINSERVPRIPSKNVRLHVMNPRSVLQQSLNNAP